MTYYPANYKTAQALFHLKPAPRGLIADLGFRLGDFGVYYLIFLYRDNFDSLPESARLAATEWVLETRNRMNAAGIAVDLETEERPPGIK